MNTRTEPDMGAIVARDDDRSGAITRWRIAALCSDDQPDVVKDL